MPAEAGSGSLASALPDWGDRWAHEVERGNDPVRTRAAFLSLVRCDGLDAVPLPGVDTARRFAALTAVSAESPSVGRLVEGHLDAVAILAELGGAAPPGAVLGVWASEWDGHQLEAERLAGGWRVRGLKPFASGAGFLTHALVTAREGEDRLLFLTDVAAGATPIDGSWPAVGMAGTDSRTVAIDVALPDAALLGEPGDYVERPGFWHGAAGVAACWLGGAHGVARPLFARVGDDPHVDAHAGAVDAALAAAGSLVAKVAAEIDDDPDDQARTAQVSALRVRAAVEHAATLTLDRVGRALGAAPLCLDSTHGRRVADLTTYLRQSHAERDLVRLARLRHA